MEVPTEESLEQEIAHSPASFLKFLESQRELLHSQIDQLQNVVVTQCKLTGVNPLSQEMAAGALSIKIGKRPRDLLNPKAVKYMQSVFAIKDAISKKESREISARFGVKVTQVRDFFASQQTRVRRFVRLSREKALRSEALKNASDNVPSNSEPLASINPVPLSAVGPSNVEEVPSCPSQNDTLSDIDELDKHFVNNIFSLMGKEETFSGQVKLMKWILTIQSTAVLSWFLTKGGAMIIATWLSQAATEEQTSVLFVILEVLSHLPIHEAVPAHVSAILQSVNSLRFYRTSDVSNRAKALLAKWSKMFVRAQALKKPNGMKSSDAVLKERAWKQSLSEIMGEEALQSNANVSIWALNRKEFLHLMKVQRIQEMKERRKVQFVEQPGQKFPSRGPQASKAVPAMASRPITVDDIKKAKLRASFMQSKYWKRAASATGNDELKTENQIKPSISDTSNLPPVPKAEAAVQPQIEAEVQPQVEEQKIAAAAPASIPEKPDSPLKPKLDLMKPRLEECGRSKIQWRLPPEVRLNDLWRVGGGEDSKEVEVQRNRTHREKETLYRTTPEIPPNPKEPWDREMDYDDSLTPLIPIEQLPDADAMETSEEHINRTLPSNTTLASSLPVSQNASSLATEPDMELLAVLLKNPELVFALTSGQAGNLSNEDTIRLLDLIKTGGAGNSIGIAGSGGRREEKVEVSLPSPTPSSDPGTNPFSQQRQMSSSRATSQIPTDPDPNVVLHQQLTNLQQLLQLRQLQPAAVPSAPMPSITFDMQHSSLLQAGEVAPARPPISSPALPNPSSGPVPVPMNMRDRLYGAQTQPHHLYAEPTVQKQLYHGSSPIGQPVLGSNSWRDGLGYPQNPHSHVNNHTTNFNTSHDGWMRDGNSHVGGAGRYPEYMQGRSFPEPVSNPGQAYRPQRPGQRDSPVYWDPNRQVERWQYDRRY
ncbi:hypothetical protein CRG98_037420 [Punica granatum]|uniref:Homeobox domain-containing protein n=1 Tax=Punica granatum TaxID=22663 RepID=A0A2I0IDX9_PUNGR|nr:hypothetical protein CRG98_037420 [Punica granatum]